MLRILANDGMDKAAVDHLQSLGHEVCLDTYSIEELKTELKDFDAIVIRSATKIRAELIDAVAGSRLKLIVRAGVGVDNIDVKYAEEKGITVRNTPYSSSASVAELTLAHMFSVARFVGVATATMRNGEWNKKAYKGTEISGKTLGLIGFGRIAQEVARKATVLGMRVVYFDHHPIEHSISGCTAESMEDVIKEADYISLHVPYIKEIGPIIQKEQFDMMKDGVYLINCARGGVVKEADLLDALNSGKVAGAGIDVFEEEPTKNMELINHPLVSATPHIGASTKEAQERIGVETYNVILEELA
ncbi:3-phosphoglycerate dehydrogenase [Acidaminobacter sp. JC074]|uniref:D-2-hydroxyacid dehydrogenase n=1 Tax=Acidaminobacter sp. JC074 TaxID=2530199 RepID=UPI001F0FDE8E|nr:D-2-hydroxyacid dehydrogenase [Acidaminobacter sp. JC074]MCH4889481.1 3-phosphoglycerate dehydrogenase [Acidaminobacter sp. JC074]